MIEIDGGYHYETGEEDENRENWMESKGIKTVRFTNDEIEKNMEGVVQYLDEIIKERENEIGL